MGTSAKIFQPINVGSLTLRNRIVFVPFETNYATADSYPTDKHVELYRRVAAGGTGLIVLEASNVNPNLIATKYGMSIAKDYYIPYFKKIVEAVHQEGCKIILQIADKSILNQGRTVSEMSKEEMDDLRDHFINATVRTEQAGFDGVEYHAAHLYTLADFLSKDGNDRTDEYGGSFNGRMKFITEIYSGAKAKVGKDFLFAIRFNGDEFMFGGNTNKDAVKIAQELEKMGFDLLDISAGGRIEKILKSGKWGGWSESYSSQRCIPPQQYSDACNIHLAGGVKAGVSKVPVIGAGKIGDIDLASRLVDNGTVDLVGLGRALFCDPDFTNKAQRGDKVQKCSWCGHCHKTYAADETVTCLLWKDK